MTALDLQIVNARVVTAHDTFDGCIGIQDGVIVTLTAAPYAHAKRTIDAAGRAVLPGMVDQHVHFMDPGALEREDFIHGSMAAAVGGVTTVVEHTHSQPVLSAADLERKVAYLRGRSYVDFGLCAHVFPQTIPNVAELAAAGAAYFKVFTCTTHGVPALLSDDLLRLFRLLPAHGARALVHAEDEFITEDDEARLRADDRSDYGVIPEWRSPEAEEVAVNAVAQLARMTGARVTIAHASQPEVIALVRRERARGADLTVESCPQYFYLDEGQVREHGPVRKFTPPARDASLHDAMWSLLAAGEIDLVSTDHAPATLDQKYGAGIWDCPFGLPGVETTLLMLLEAVHAGRLTLPRVVEAYSTRPAQLLGLYPRKGAIRLGSDADLVMVDLAAEYRINNADVVSKAGWTPYDGVLAHGVPVMTIRRGEVLTEGREVVAARRGGAFVRPL